MSKIFKNNPKFRISRPKIFRNNWNSLKNPRNFPFVILTLEYFWLVVNYLKCVSKYKTGSYLNKTLVFT